jgi:UDP-2,3-diacylglucosamine hydrolase
MHTLPEGKKIYFASDFHLGLPSGSTSRLREQLLVNWLNSIIHDAHEVFLMGDVFDFWFEYKQVVPKGYTRLLGKLAELADKGIRIHYFTGNHDMWVFTYFTEEFQAVMHRSVYEFSCMGKNFHIGHGDGLGKGDHGYKLIKKIFASPICQFLFRWMHPDLGISIANFFSKRSRHKTGHLDEVFLGEDKERLIGYCREIANKKPVDYFIFGHRHLLLDYPVSPTARYINLGDWFKGGYYAEFDGKELYLKSIAI